MGTSGLKNGGRGWKPGRTSADDPQSGERKSISGAQWNGCVNSIYEVNGRPAYVLEALVRSRPVDGRTPPAPAKC